MAGGRCLNSVGGGGVRCWKEVGMAERGSLQSALCSNCVIVNVPIVYFVYTVLQCGRCCYPWEKWGKGSTGPLCGVSELQVQLQWSHNTNLKYQCVTLGELLTSLSLRFFSL